MNEFLTPDVLSTMIGLVSAVMLIVQFTKSIIKRALGDEFVKLYAFIIALGLSFIFTNSGYDIQGITLTILNAIIVATSAIGGYEIVIDPKSKKSK